MIKLDPDFDPRALPDDGMLWHYGENGWVRQTVMGARVQAAYERGEITRQAMADGSHKWRMLLQEAARRSQTGKG